MASFPTTTENPANPDVYVIAAHPAWRESRVNRPLMQAAKAQGRVATANRGPRHMLDAFNDTFAWKNLKIA